MVTANNVGDKGGKQESQQKKTALKKSVAYNTKDAITNISMSVGRPCSWFVLIIYNTVITIDQSTLKETC